ncbi:exportin-2 [Pycnococcus provasolii]
MEQLATSFHGSLATAQDQRQAAEASLRSYASSAGYGPAVLSLIAGGSASLPFPAHEAPAVILAASVHFKNTIKRRWTEDSGDVDATSGPISDADKEQIKPMVVQLACSPSLAPNVQAQISEALAIISKHDFPHRWSTLLPELVANLNKPTDATSAAVEADLLATTGVLSAANAIFKRYRGQVESAELNVELKTVLDTFAMPLLAKTKQLAAIRDQLSQPATAGGADSPAANALRQCLRCSRLVNRIFFSLHSTTLPEVFEDHLGDWMGEFQAQLAFENASLAQDGTDAAASAKFASSSPLLDVKASVCENLSNYILRFEEEFQPYLAPFSAQVWQLLMASQSASSAADPLSISAIGFLTSVAKSVHHKLFQDESALTNIVQHVVVPNVKLSEEEVELFDFNYTEYVRRDLEGSDNDTRRRSACELLQALCAKFPERVTALTTAYVGQLMTEYASNPANAWRGKDVAMQLVLALAVRGKTAATGATGINTLVNISEFFTGNIVPELRSAAASPSAELPTPSAVLACDALKFVTTFRSHLPKETLLGLFPDLIKLLGVSNNVVHSYAAICLERILALREGTTRASPPKIAGAELAPVLEQLLTRLFACFDFPDSKENEYAMKCLMRVLGALEPAHVFPIFEAIVPKLCAIIAEVSANPSKPNFNHALFEALASIVADVVRHAKAGGGDPPAVCRRIEALVFPTFQLVLQNDVQEFAPYIFQIMALLLEAQEPVRGGVATSGGADSGAVTSSIPEVYLTLFPVLLSPLLWERRGNVPALVRLLEAYLTRGVLDKASAQLQGVLGVFQKLVANKAHDHEGFYILNAVTASLDLATFQPYVSTILTLLFSRLQTSSTLKFSKYFVVYFSLFSLRFGPEAIVASIEAVQAGVFGNLLQGVLVPTATSHVSGDSECTMCCAALMALLVQRAQMLSEMGAFGGVLGAAVALAERASGDGGSMGAGPSTAPADDEEPGADVEYGVTFATLMHARRDAANAPIERMVTSIGDPRQHVASQIGALQRTHPNLVTSAALMQHITNPNLRERLGEWLVKGGVALQ